MKKALILTTLMTSAVGATMQTEVFADEKESQNNTSSKSSRVKESTLKGKVVNLKSGDTLNVREKSNANAKLLFTLNSGEVVTILNKESNGWLKIQKGSQIGFVNGRYISTYTETIEKAMATDAINLRASASWSGEKITVISKGSWLKVLSKGSEWTKVSYNNQEGYVPTSYLDYNPSNNNTDNNTNNNTGSTTPSTPQPTPSYTETNYSAKGKVVKISSNDVLNVRANPDADSKLVTTLKLNQVVTITKKVSNGWYKISANNLTGYVNGIYISITEESPKHITTDRVNLRSSKSWSSTAVILTIEKNQTVNLLEKDSEWAKVEYNNQIGYVPLSYIKLEGSSNNQTPSTSDKVGKIGNVNATSLNIRSGPGTSYSILTKTYDGDIVLIKEVSSNGWYKVETTSGITGWCSGDYIINIRQGSLPSYGDTVDEKVNNVLKLAKEQLGKPYKYGAEGPDAFDCSGLSYYVFKNAAGITLPRSSSAQASAGKAVSRSELKPGDLVFFNTSGSGISHLGIYMGNDEMLHAPSSGKTIEITKITSSYWSSRYVTARRIIG